MSRLQEIISKHAKQDTITQDKRPHTEAAEDNPIGEIESQKQTRVKGTLTPTIRSLTKPRN